MTEPNVVPVTPTDVDGVMSWCSHASVIEPREPITPEELARFRERGPLTTPEILSRMAQHALDVLVDHVAGDVE